MSRFKIQRQKHKMGKPEVVQLMLDLGCYDTKKDAAKAYDAMTSALNAWLMNGTRNLLKGLHLTLVLRDAMTLHLC